MAEKRDENERRPYNRLANTGWDHFSAFSALTSSTRTPILSKRSKKDNFGTDCKQETSITTYGDDSGEDDDLNISYFTQSYKENDREDIEIDVPLSPRAMSEDLFEIDVLPSQKISPLNSIQSEESDSFVISSISPTPTTIESPLKGTVWFEAIRKQIPDLDQDDFEKKVSTKSIKPLKGGFAEQLEETLKRWKNTTIGVQKIQASNLSVEIMEVLSEFDPFVFACRLDVQRRTRDVQSVRTTSYERYGIVLTKQIVCKYGIRVGCVVHVKLTLPMYPVPSLRMSVILASSVISVTSVSSDVHPNVSDTSLYNFRCDCQPDLNACHFWLNEFRRPCYGSFTLADVPSTEVAEPD